MIAWEITGFFIKWAAIVYFTGMGCMLVYEWLNPRISESDVWNNRIHAILEREPTSTTPYLNGIAYNYGIARKPRESDYSFRLRMTDALLKRNTVQPPSSFSSRLILAGNLHRVTWTLEGI